MRLAVLVLATHVPAGGSGGGMVRYVVELVSALHRRQDVSVHVLSSHSAAAWWQDRLPIAQVHRRADLPAPASATADLLGLGVPRNARFDVILGTKHLLPRRRLAPTQLLTVHDMLPLDRPADFGPFKRHLLRRPYLESIRRADLLLSVSQASRARLLSYVPEAADRVRVVPLAASAALLAAKAEPVTQLRGARFVLTVGDPSARKNLTTLLDAWRRISPRGPAERLVVVGPPGWGRAQVADLDGVVRLGHVRDSQLRWCYENAAAVMVPSVLEGFGLPAAEAAALGAPLAISEDPALREAAGEGALVLNSAQPREWAAAMSQALVARPARDADVEPRSTRTWDDVAEETMSELWQRREGAHRVLSHG